MKSFNPYRLALYLVILFNVFLLSGCAIVGGIFKAGVWVGVFAVIVVVGLVVWLISRGGGEK